MKTLKYTLLVLAILGCGAFSSCSDDDEAIAPLSIAKVSTVTDRKEAIDKANLAQYIIVQGTGLNAVTSILVNDVPVDMLEAYITSNETPLSVFVPDLRIDGMYNEFTPAGEMMKIVGDYFDLYEITTESGKLYFGDREMEIVRAVQDTLYFKLPTDAAVGAKVKIVSPVVGEVMVPGKYKEKGNMLCDYDPFTGWGGGQYLSSGPTPVAISGQYCRFNIAKGDANDWDWNSVTGISQLAVEYFPEVLANQNNYLLKFEVNTLKPLTKRQIRFYFSQINYDWEPFASGLALNTNGEWQTVTLELGTMWKGSVPADGVLQIMGNSYAEDTDISFDNFRIVPKD